MKEQILNIPTEELHAFPDNPFAVREDIELRESVKDYGVLTPITVRPRETGGYEIISGHRRCAACQAAGIAQVPAFVRDMDDNTAVIALVDSNLHREQILPSEKAKAYKMKLDAIKRQGERNDLYPWNRTRGQAVHKSRDEVAQSESGRQVQRYVRLCELNPQLLQLVDEGKMALSPAVELSYLNQYEQKNLVETIESEDRTPSHAQAIRLRRQSEAGRLNMDATFNIMTEEKGNQKEHLKIKTESIERYFPKGYSPRQMQDTIIKLLAEWQQKRERAAKNRDSR